MFTLMESDGDGIGTFDELKARLKKVGSLLADPAIKLLMDVFEEDWKGRTGSIDLGFKILRETNKAFDGQGVGIFDFKGVFGSQLIAQ
nr:calcium-dependent protein kinase 10-like [Tanacetum cinerariifolium]